MPLVVNVMFLVKRGSSPNSICNYWLKWITLNFVPYPVKDAFSCCYWSLPNLLLRLFCVNTVGSSSAACQCAQERNTLALSISVLLYPECSSSFCKWRCEGNLSDSYECLYSSAGSWERPHCLQYKYPQSSWKFFGLCRVHAWHSLSCQGEMWCVPDSASQQLHWLGVKKRSRSSGCAAVVLVPFKLLRFFLWLYGKIYFWLCHLLLLLRRMFSFICNAPCLFLLKACF